MKLFFRALLLGVLGLSSLGGGLIWGISMDGGDPTGLALNLFGFLVAMLFGVTALLYAHDDWSAYRKTHKKQNHAIQSALILLVLFVLAVAGYSYWKSQQPVNIELTYVNGTTNQPIAFGTITLASNQGNIIKDTDIVVHTDANGKALLTLKPKQSYEVLYGEGINRQISYEYLDTWNFVPAAMILVWQPNGNGWN